MARQASELDNSFGLLLRQGILGKEGSSFCSGVIFRVADKIVAFSIAQNSYLYTSSSIPAGITLRTKGECGLVT
ncbi:hypothetical protein Cni_G23820 [Canna indica]|uniref:Uncharacterized protein n=1 Tax=Canna indica TaxID=4628 RepID=A0AAQ3KUJ2_9LILI|nr:hypothetical protein Cni_G23820 [Canna indica]